jgi:hypothetical protein
VPKWKLEKQAARAEEAAADEAADGEKTAAEAKGAEGLTIHAAMEKDFFKFCRGNPRDVCSSLSIPNAHGTSIRPPI